MPTELSDAPYATNLPFSLKGRAMSVELDSLIFEETNELPDRKYCHRFLPKISNFSRYPFSLLTCFLILFA